MFIFKSRDPGKHLRIYVSAEWINVKCILSRIIKNWNGFLFNSFFKICFIWSILL